MFETLGEEFSRKEGHMLCQWRVLFANIIPFMRGINI